MKNLLAIIRWPNLLMVAGIQTIVYFRLLEWQISVLSVPDLILLICGTVLLAAGGYVINDYFDADIDRINKPAKWIAGNSWSLQKVRTVYLGITGVGLIISTWLAFRIDLPEYLFIYPVAVAGLWFYSVQLKCTPFLGNLWVSIFCAAVIGVIGLPDIILKNEQAVKNMLWYYMAFAFLATWYREVIKDVEDVEGDAANKCNTAVVKFGMNVGRWMAIVLGVLLIVALWIWESRQQNELLKTCLLVLQGITVASMAFFWWAKTNQYYHHASNMVKLVMVGGTLILLLQT